MILNDENTLFIFFSMFKKWLNMSRVIVKFLILCIKIYEDY